MERIYYFCIFVSLSSAPILHRNLLVSGQTTPNPAFNDTFLRDDAHYCFEFTWLGPKYDNASQFPDEYYCGDALDASGADNSVPCTNPLVVTYDATPPDMDYLWKYYRNNVLCRRTDSGVCATYTYRFGGEIYNATHMCTKSRSMTDGTIVESGCYKQNKNGFEIETCICKQGTGYRAKPCNSAKGSFERTWLPISLLLSFFYIIS